MSKMKIAFVSQPWEDVDPPVQGGSLAIWTYQVMQRLSAQCDFIVYARQGHSQQRVQWHNNIQYRRVSVGLEDQVVKGFKLLERFFKHPWPKRPFFSRSLYYLGYIRQIANDLRKQQCDIVHIWNFSQFVPIVRAALPQAKIVLHMQCDWLVQLDHHMIKRRLAHVDMMVGCSEHVTRAIRHRFPYLAGRCKTIYNGVDFNKIGHDDYPVSQTTAASPKRLLFVGRVSPEKGVHVLLDAFKIVAAQRPQVYLDIVGPINSAPFEFMVLVSQDPIVSNLAEFYRRRFKRPDYRAALQARIPSGLAEQVNLVGPVDHSATAQYFRRANILINPSLTEAFGMSLVEAMAHRLPVVASRVGGMTEIVQDCQTGLLVEAGDPAALANTLLKLLDDEDRCRDIGRTGYERARSLFSWDSIAQNLMAQYKHLHKSQENLESVYSG